MNPSKKFGSGWQGACLVAITYVYFLIFAQFAFLKRLATLGITDAHLKPVMEVMAVGGILLIACVNLSNLLLARAAARSKEFAMRGALGAGRMRIVRQLLTESMLLASGGALLGFLLALILVSWLRHQGAIALPLLSTLHLDWTALGWTVLFALLEAMAFGVVIVKSLKGSRCVARGK